MWAGLSPASTAVASGTCPGAEVLNFIVFFVFTVSFYHTFYFCIVQKGLSFGLVLKMCHWNLIDVCIHLSSAFNYEVNQPLSSQHSFKKVHWIITIFADEYLHINRSTFVVLDLMALKWIYLRDRSRLSFSFKHPFTISVLNIRRGYEWAVCSVSETCGGYLTSVQHQWLPAEGWLSSILREVTVQCSVSSQHRLVMDWMFCCCSSAYIKLPIFSIVISNHCRLKNI